MKELFSASSPSLIPRFCHECGLFNGSLYCPDSRTRESSPRSCTWRHAQGSAVSLLAAMFNQFRERTPARWASHHGPISPSSLRRIWPARDTFNTVSENNFENLSRTGSGSQISSVQGLVGTRRRTVDPHRRSTHASARSRIWGCGFLESFQ